jgi:hypothetical protein
VEYDLKRSFMFSSAICVRFTGFSFLLALNQDSFGSGIYPKTSCELNCTSKGFSCNFLDLAVRQSPHGLSCDIFDNRSLSFPFLSFFVSLSCHCCCGLLLASSMAESYRCFQNCRRNSVRRLVLVIDLYPL